MERPERVLEAFADWAAGLTLEDLPEDVVRLARAEIANTVAAGRDGYLGDAGERTEALRTHAGAGPCSAFGAGGVDVVGTWIREP